MTRTCPICNVDKPLEDFPKKPKGPFSWMCRACERNRASLRKHGITIEQKQEIAKHQGGCAICGHPDPGTKGWVVDHDHNCCDGEKSCVQCRRGVLCGYCNRMLGDAFDRIETLKAAVAYLEKHATGTCDWHMPLACAPGLCTNGRSTRTNEELTHLEKKSCVSNVREKTQQIIPMEGKP